MSHQPRPNPICTVCRKPILPGAGRTRRGLTSTHVECEKRHRPGSSRPKSESPERPRATVVSTSGRHQDKESSASPLSAYHAGGLEGARTGCDARLSHAPSRVKGNLRESTRPARASHSPRPRGLAPANGSDRRTRYIATGARRLSSSSPCRSSCRDGVVRQSPQSLPVRRRITTMRSTRPNPPLG